MTIKELEERTGMTRANIRYYEDEKLIAPKRLPNGYRDYSEEDVGTLEKIRLLRQLHLDIDTIRLVQQGQLTLEQALFSLLNRLEGDKAAIGRAVEVCREIEQSGVEYAALEAKPWLERLEQPQRPTLPPNFPRNFSGEKEKPEALEPVDWACNHPWLRFFARGLDVSIHGLVIDALILLVFRWNYANDGTFGRWFVGLLSVVFTLLCEPFWLHFWGWTPGKWLLGLKVRDYKGRKLAISEGFTRSGGVFFSGYGLNIPIANLWCAWKFWKRYENEEDSPWDDGPGRRYTYEEPRKWAAPAVVAAYVLCIIASAAVAFQGYLPPNRGDLTAAEYYENFNFYLEYLGVDSSSYLDENGELVRKNTSGTGVAMVYVFGKMDYSVSVAEEDGRITAVTLTETLDGDPYAGTNVTMVNGDAPTSVYMTQAYYQIATVALAGAQREFNCFNYDLDGWFGLWNDQWDDFELDYRGLHISQMVECSGYEGVGQYREAIEGEEQSYTRTVTISLIGSE